MFVLISHPNSSKYKQYYASTIEIHTRKYRIAINTAGLSVFRSPHKDKDSGVLIGVEEKLSKSFNFEGECQLGINVDDVGHNGYLEYKRWKKKQRRNR